MTHVESAAKKQSIRDLRVAGFKAAEVAHMMSVSIALVYKVCSGMGLPRSNARTNPRTPDARAIRMMEMYRSGLTLQQIGTRYQVSRERVRQILRRFECLPQEGGSCRRGKNKREQYIADREQRSFKRHGCSYEEYLAIRAEGATKPWRFQKRSARYRGIHWDLNLKQWWDIWQKSGHWHERGRGKDLYCMARVSDEGGYAYGNVYITTLRENGQEYQQNRDRNKQRDLPKGIYLMLPGYYKPYLAKYGSKNLGYHRTADEAIAARDAYCRAAA
jgi:transposase